MRLGLLAAAFILLFAFPAAAKTKVLFIGNSLTSYHDIPLLVNMIAAEKGQDIDVASFAPGGAHFESHALNAELSELIRLTKWDKVILQEQSQRTAFGLEQRSREVFPYAINLVQKIRASSPEADVIFYMTFAHKEGDQNNKDVIPEIGTYMGMQKPIIESYQILAEENQARIAPVGFIWTKYLDANPSVDLYEDDRHQNKTGAYLIACTLFVTMFPNSTCQGNNVPRVLDIDPLIARSIESKIDEIMN